MSFFIAKRKGGDEMRKRAPKKGRNTVRLYFGVIPRNNTSGVRYLYGRNVKEGVIVFVPISDDSYIYQYDYDRFKRCHIKGNDVLIAIYGTVGKSAVYKSSYVGVAGIPRHIANITLKCRCPK